MKVQCDVCGAEAAAVFCCADEAALCGACDRRVHRANKLAGKHRRLAFLHPSPSSASTQSPPLCDVCQERRGFLFCHEDRAILCRNCDVPIHTANNLTMAHNRYLLTGVRLSATPIPSSDAEVAVENSSGSYNSHRSESAKHEATSAAAEETLCSSSTTTTTTTSRASAAAEISVCNSSSISDYLIKMLPGWHVEDFLTDDAATATDAAGDGFYQVDENSRSDGLSGAKEQFSTWVSLAGETGEFLQGIGTGEVKAGSRQPWREESHMVPQIHYQWNGKKRSRAAQWYL